MNIPQFNEILIVEDNTVERRLIKRRISKADASREIIEAVNGKEALDYLCHKFSSSDKIDHKVVITLDINMPIMNGRELLKELDKCDFKSSLSVIIVSSSDNSEDISLCRSYEFVDDYITKPLNQDMVEKILNG